MPRCGATSEENIPLQGGASDSGRLAPKARRRVVRCGGRLTPAASGSHPPHRGSSEETGSQKWLEKMEVKGRRIAKGQECQQPFLGVTPQRERARAGWGLLGFAARS